MAEFRESQPSLQKMRSFLIYDESGSTLRKGGDRPISPRASAKAALLGNLLSKALGSIKPDRARRNVYYVEEGCVQVRQTLAVDHFYYAHEITEESAVRDHVRSVVDPVFDQGEDALIVVGGYSGTLCRIKQVHGTTLELPTSVQVAADSSFTFVPPPRATWGSLLHMVEYVLDKASKDGTSVSVTSIRVQLDNVVDALISPSALKVKFGDQNQGQRIRQQYTKLLALTSASTLDVEDDSGVAKITDQTVCNLHCVDDFFHLVNCFSASSATKHAASAMASSAAAHHNNHQHSNNPGTQNAKPQGSASMAQKGSAPAHGLTTLRLTSLNGSVRRIHLLELADLDWTGPSKEDQSDYESALQNLFQVLAAIEKGNVLTVDSIARKYTLTHVLSSMLRPLQTRVYLYGHTRYSTSFAMMKVMAQSSNTPIRTVLHGPDLEGEMEVDVELRKHLEEIQQECETLQREVDDLQERKNDLDNQIRTTDEKMARIEQRRATMMRMSFATRRRAENDNDSNNIRGGKKPSELVVTHGRGGKIVHASMNAAKCYNLHEELHDLQKTHVKVMRTADKQLDILMSEKVRVDAKVQKLQSEYEKLRERWKHENAEHAKDLDALRREYASKTAAVIDARKQETDRRNLEQKRLIAQELERSKARADEAAKREHEEAEQRKANRVAEEARQLQERAREQAVRQRICETQEALAALQLEQEHLENSGKHDDQALQRRLSELEQAAAVLNEFAFRMSSALSSMERRMHDKRMIRIVVHEPQQKHDAVVLRSRTRVLMRWLEQGGMQHRGTCAETAAGEVVEAYDDTA